MREGSFRFMSILIKLAIFCQFLIIVQSEDLQSYGDFCNNAIKCSESSWLKCHDGICNCTNPNEMKWEESENHCATLAGEKCIHVTTEGEIVLLMHTNCVQNSVCSKQFSKLCECTKDYKNLNGSCVLKKSYGESCRKQDDCLSTKSLKCSNGICICDYGQEATTNKTCVQAFSSFCSNDKPCNLENSISCKNSIGNLYTFNCHCRNSKHQYYDQLTRKCKTLVHGICRINSDCTFGANCVESEIEGPSRCSCGPGFVENDDGKCDIENGFPCSNMAACDRYSKLVCDNNVCSCGDENLFYNNGECFVRPGSRCKISNFECKDSQCTKLDYACGGSSICQGRNFRSKEYGICTCVKGCKLVGDKCINDN